MGWLASIAQLLALAIAAVGLLVGVSATFYIEVVMLGHDGGIGLRSALWAAIVGWVAFVAGKRAFERLERRS
jgi:hypothetical protein